MSRNVSLLTAVGLGLVILMMVQRSTELDNRDSVLLYNLQTAHNQMYDGQSRSISETLRLFWRMRSIHNAGTDQFKALIEASEIKEERCNGNFSFEYDKLIRENSFDPNNTVPYLKQSKLAQAVLCLRLGLGEALSAIGKENRENMENLAQKFRQLRPDDHTNPVLLYLEEKIGPLCTNYVYNFYDEIYNRTIGQMVQVINHFGHLLTAANDLRDQVELNLRLTGREMEWLFSCAPTAAELDAYPEDAANATRRGLVQYCANRTNHIGILNNQTYAKNMSDLIQSIAKHCSTDRKIGTIDFPLNKAKFIDGLLDYIEQKELRESTPATLETFKLILNKFKNHLCSPTLADIMAMGLRVDLTVEQKDSAEQARRVCQYISDHRIDLTNATYIVYSNRHSFIHP